MRAVAAVMASCVAESVMTGLLGGGHAVYWDAATGEAWNLDCFCAAPSGEGGELVQLRVPFGEELVHYAIGPASFAVPRGFPQGSARCTTATGGCRGPTCAGRRWTSPGSASTCLSAQAACLAMSRR